MPNVRPNNTITDTLNPFSTFTRTSSSQEELSSYNYQENICSPNNGNRIIDLELFNGFVDTFVCNGCGVSCGYDMKETKKRPCFDYYFQLYRL